MYNDNGLRLIKQDLFCVRTKMINVLLMSRVSEIYIWYLSSQDIPLMSSGYFLYTWKITFAQSGESKLKYKFTLSRIIITN